MAFIQQFIYMFLAAMTCTECSAGTYCPHLASSPISCPSGFYSSAGAEQPTQCQAGKSCSSTAETDCQDGYYSQAMATSCTMCPAGQSLAGLLQKTVHLTLLKIAIWLSKNLQKLYIFFKKIAKIVFFSTKLPMAHLQRYQTVIQVVHHLLPGWWRIEM